MKTVKTETLKIDKPKPKTAIEKILDAINKHRIAIFDSLYEKWEIQYKESGRDYATQEDSVYLKSIKNMYGTPYVEGDIINRQNLMQGEGVLVFKDGKKYTVKKDGGDFKAY